MRFIHVFTSIILISGSSNAQTWQSLNPQIAGSPFGSGPRPISGSTWFAGTATGDYRSTDNGATWTNSSSGLLDGTGRIISAVSYFKTSTGRILRAGATSSWNNKVGSPVFYSDNDGATWSESPLPFTLPTGGNQLFIFHNYAEKNGTIFAACGSNNFPLFKSTDDGLTWSALPNLSFSQNNLQAVAVNNAGIYVAHSTNGIFRSTDNGATFQLASNGIPGLFNFFFGTIRSALDVISLADGTLFAQVDDGLWRSTDNAENWTEVTASLGQAAIESISSDGTKVYAFTRSRVLLETLDKGASFQIVDGGAPPALRTLSERHMNTANGVAIYATDSEFFRLDLNTAPRTAILPSIINPPLSKTVNLGKPLVLSVTHSSATLPISYVWKRDGNIVPSQSGSTLTIPSTSAGDAGDYTVEITNGAGTTVNPVPATVVIAPNTPGNIDYTIQPVTLSTLNIARTRGLAQGADGSIFVAGEFDASATVPGRRVIRILPDGTIDPLFKPTSASINFEDPFAVQPLSDGSVIVGGGGSQYLRRLDPTGAIDLGFDWPQLLGGVTYAIAPGPGDTTYVGGSYGLYRIFNTNGHIDFTFNPPDLGGDVRDIAIAPDGKIVIGGRFTNTNGRSSSRISRLLPDGNRDTTFDVGTGFNNDVFTVDVQEDGKILAAGIFTAFRSVSAQRIVRINVDGTTDTTFVPPVLNSTINSVVVDGSGGVLIAGAFTTVGGTASNNIARLNPSNGSHDTSFPGQASNLEILSMSIQPDGNILTGTNRGFTRIIGVAPSTPRISFLSGDTAAALGQAASLEVRLSGPSAGATFKWFKDGVLLPTETTAILSRPSLSQAHVGAYRVEVTIGSSVFKSGETRLDLLGSPYFITTPDTTPGSVTYRHHFSARAKGTGPISYQWFKNGAAISTGTGLFINALAETDAGTYFVRATSPAGSVDTAPFYFAVLPKIGSIDPSVVFKISAAAAQGVSHDALLPLDDGTFLGGGTLANTGFPSRFLRKYFPDGTWDQSFSSDSLGLTTAVRQIIRQSSGEIIIASANLTIRLNSDLTLDPSFSTPSTTISQIALLPDDKLLVRGGAVSGYAGGLYRISANGAIDTSFPSTTFTGGFLRAIGTDSSGRILLGGTFSQVNGSSRRSIARLSANGTLDADFTGPVGSGAAAINFVTTAPDGSVFVGGNPITGLAEGYSENLIKLDKTTGQLDPSFYPTKGGGSPISLEFFPDGRIGVFGNFGGSLFQIRFPNGAPDPATFSTATAISGTANSQSIHQPSLPGTHLVPGTMALNGVNGYNRLFTGSPPLAFVTQPTTSVATTPANTVNLNSSVTLTASALGTSAVSYQWYFNDQILPGATSRTLTFNSVQKVNEGSYTLTATNASGTLTSSPVFLTVLGIPEILTHPLSSNLSAGNTVSLFVAAKGRPNLTYAWTKDGVTITNISGKISGATTPTLTLTGITEAQAGAYRAVVTNTLGTTASNIADVSPVFVPGRQDTTFTAAVPTPLTNFNVRLLGTSDGGFFATGSFTFNNRREAARYTAEGTLDPIFIPPSNPTMQTLNLKIFALDPNEQLMVLARSRTSSDCFVFRFAADGIQTQVGTLTMRATEIMIDPQNRLIVAAEVAPFLKRYQISGNTLTEDTTFAPTFNGAITGVYPSPSTGGYYVTGGFSQVDGVARTGGIARITSTGALDTTFADYFTGPGTTGFAAPTFVLELPNGKVHLSDKRLNANGTLDPTWIVAPLVPGAPVMGGFVDPSGKTLILYNDAIRRYFPDSSLDPSFAGRTVGAPPFQSIIQTTGGQVYLGGRHNPGVYRMLYEPATVGFSVNPSNETVNAGQAATITAGVYGTGITYKWYQNGSLLTDGGRISGADSPSITIANTTAADSGSFRLEISNTEALSSRTAFLRVNALPTNNFANWSEITTVPANQRGPLDDPDGDGLPNLIEFALNLAPGNFNTNPHPTSFVSVNGQPFPAATFTRRKDLGDTILSVQISADLAYTNDLGSTIVSITDNNDGTETVVVRSNVAQASLRAQFFRLRAQ